MRYSVFQVGLTAIAALCASDIAASAAWEPVRPVEFIVPGGHRRWRGSDGADDPGHHHQA